jgi:hypothetical protein
MTLIRRRRFLANLLTAPLGFSALSADASIRRTLAQDDDRGLSAGCILAWENKDHCDGSIDFWTMRASDIDPATFSTSAQRVVLWDDVFWLKTIRQIADEIKAAIPEYFGFDPRVQPNGFAFHADGMNTFDQVLAQVFEVKSRDPNRARTALLDLDSSGVTALDWSQILPRIRSHYDFIVGVAHATHLCTSPEKLRPIGSGGSFIYDSTWRNMQKCDFSVVYSDTLLSGNPEPNLEEMGGSPSGLISSLTSALNNQRLIRRLSKRSAGKPAIPPMFGISGVATRLTDEGHFSEISAQQNVLEKLFGSLSEEQTVLMLDIGEESGTIRTLSLWPITMK